MPFRVHCRCTSSEEDDGPHCPGAVRELCARCESIVAGGPTVQEPPATSLICDQEATGRIPMVTRLIARRRHRAKGRGEGRRSTIGRSMGPRWVIGGTETVMDAYEGWADD